MSLSPNELCLEAQGTMHRIVTRVLFSGSAWCTQAQDRRVTGFMNVWFEALQASVESWAMSARVFIYHARNKKKIIPNLPKQDFLFRGI